MPRADRHFLPDHVRHITYHRYQREIFLKFARVLRRCCLFTARG